MGVHIFWDTHRLFTNKWKGSRNKLLDGEVPLVEIAPGIDLQKDILAQMDFNPRIAPDLKLMPE